MDGQNGLRVGYGFYGLNGSGNIFYRIGCSVFSQDLDILFLLV